MKTLLSHPLSLPVIALLSLLTHRPGAWGQTQGLEELLAGLPEGTYGRIAPGLPDVRYELVDRRYLPTAYALNALLRTIRRVADDRFDVRVVAADGTLRMCGSYRDEGLQVAHGSFEYFHFNGQVECRGEYALGNKSGVWERYALDGRRLAERVYTGLSVEVMVRIATGESELVRTSGGDR